MKMIILTITTALLIACSPESGSRDPYNFRGSVSEECVDGVMYLFFKRSYAGGATIKRNQDGTVVTCEERYEDSN